MPRLALVAATSCLLSSPAFADDGEAAASAGIALSTAGTALASHDVDAAPAGAAAGGVGAGAWIEGVAIYRYDTLSKGRTSSSARGHAEATARLGSDGPGLTFLQEAEVRPWGFEVFQLELADRLAFDVAPKLSDKPDRWRRRYRGAGFDVDLIGAQWIGKRFGAQMIRVDNGFDWEEQRDDASGRTLHRFLTTADWSPFSFTRRSGGEEVGRFDLIALESTAIDGEQDGVVLTQFFPRFSGVEVGPLWFDAAYGFAATGWSQISVDDEVVSTIGSANLPVIHTPAYRARLGVRTGRVDASAGVERNLHLTADSALVLEERATAELATVIRTGDLRATGFAARSRVWTSPSDSTRYVTGGGALAIDVPVRNGWQLAGSAELARSFYASIDGERGLRVDTAVRFDLGLRRRLRNWVPR